MLQLGAVERDAHTHAYDGRAIRRTFDELGWVVLPELFSEDELLPMQHRMEEHVEAAAARMGAPRPSGAQFDRRLLEVMEWAETGNPRMTPQAAGLLGLSPFAVKEGDAEDAETGGRAVFDLVTHSELLGALSVLLGPSITYSYAGICRVRLPDATNPPSRSSLPFPLHQDSQYYDTAHFTQDKGERAGTVRPGLEQSTEKLTIATVWMPLVDTDVTNGCLRLIPGSHRWGMHAGERDSDGNMRAYEDVEARAEAVPVPAKRGSAIVFHNLVFHGSGQNLSDRVRWSLDWRYAPTLSPVGNVDERNSAAEWWLESMSGKKNDYGPIAVRGATGEIVPGWETWREKALALHADSASSSSRPRL